MVSTYNPTYSRGVLSITLPQKVSKTKQQKSNKAVLVYICKVLCYTPRHARKLSRSSSHMYDFLSKFLCVPLVYVSSLTPLLNTAVFIENLELIYCPSTPCFSFNFKNLLHLFHFFINIILPISTT